MASKKNIETPTVEILDEVTVEVEETLEDQVEETEVATPEVEEVTPEAQEVLPQIGRPYAYTAKDGDTYASIAKEFLPDGYTKHEFATFLYTLNKGKSITQGTEVAL